MAVKESRLRKSPSFIHLILAAERGHWQKAAKLINDLGVIDRGRRGTLRYYYWQAGYLALKSGRNDEALEHFRSALKEGAPVYDVDPFEDCLANAYLQLGRTDEAIAEYERILRLNPNYPLAHYHLAQAYERKGEKEQARRYYEQFLQIWKDADADIPEVIAAKQSLL
jgi:tetratricopeptide (TPR) repeat protein